MCPHTASCPLFPRFTLQSALKIWQMKYCEADYKRCARYQLSLSGQPVPNGLLPNGQLLKLRAPGG
ncbi:MAG TPA: hypothetical protein VFF06_37400 [Polyangia bacterium]|nr:hypothetical protein [Polyangia bacterium]